MSRQVVETIWQDLRYGWRGLLHAPGFVLTVTVTIALGLGVNTALFTLFDANYLRPIPVRDPYSLYEVFWINRSGNANNFSWSEYREFLAQNPAFSEAAAFLRAEARLAGRHLSGVLVTDDYFRMLGVRAELGRPLLPGDDASNSAAMVVVLAHTTWQSQFGSASDIVGKKILLRGHHFEVVGVAPPEFTGLGDPTDFWAPITLASVFDPSSDLFGLSHPRALGMVARLKSGFTLRQAENGVALWAHGFTADLPAAEQAMAATSISRATRKPFNPRNNAAFFSLVLAAFAAILVIACTNVANMMLARSVARQREIGVRLSLGATRGRLIRQLLTESALMVLPSAALGILLSRGIIKACLWLLVTTLPPGVAGFMNRIPPLSPDIRVLAFSLAAAFLAAIVCGLAPALQSARTNLTQAARGDFGNNWRPSRVTNALLVGQIVVCVLMLITAGVVLRGIKGVQVLDATLSTSNAIELVIQEDSRAMVLDRISREPALRSLAAAGSAPVERKAIAFVKSASGAILASAANSVSPEYFSTFDIPLLRGRNFSAEEARSGSPVVLLSQTAASQLWHNQEPGRSLDLVAEQAASAEFRRNQTVEVVGIVGDEPSRWISGGESKAIIYFPTDSKTPGTKLFLGVHGDAEPVMHRLDADLTDALEEIDALQIRRWVIEDAYSFHVVYWVAIALGSLALLLTLSGIYGVVAHIVSQRTKEIGTRMALGATTRSVERLVLKQSMRLAVTGGIVGCMLALGVSKILSSILLMINTYDVAVYAGGIAFVWMACAAAAYLPARRVARVDPASTLRYD